MQLSTRATLTAAALALTAAPALVTPAQADENLLGYTQGAETLPKGALEVYQWLTLRSSKGQGHYEGWDAKTEVEYGLSNRFSVSGAIKGTDITNRGLIVDGYLPREKHTGPKLSGLEMGGKYNFLAPALDDFGLAAAFDLSYSWVDPHSGEDKKTYQAELTFIGQKYFMEGRLIWVGNAALESTYADRAPIPGLDPAIDWPTDPEMEIELTFGTGLSYRFADNWFLGAEVQYQTEFETEIGQERWSVFAGPSLHYGSAKWWATVTWFPQISGGGEMYPTQTDTNLHLIEKTKNEFRLKLGFNF